MKKKLHEKKAGSTITSEEIEIKGLWRVVYNHNGVIFTTIDVSGGGGGGKLHSLPQLRTITEYSALIQKIQLDHNMQ